MFDALLVSTGTVALAEIGDKTQLLALLLAARFRRPWPIVAGILVATLLNHALAGWLGALAAQWLTPDVLRWIVAGSFIAIALWTLKPDTMDEDTRLPARGAFVATTIAFFIAEIGDKTQVATVLLAAKYHPLWQPACSSSSACGPRSPDCHTDDTGALAYPPGVHRGKTACSTCLPASTTSGSACWRVPMR